MLAQASDFENHMAQTKVAFFCIGLPVSATPKAPKKNSPIVS